MDVLCTFQIKIEGHNSEHGSIKDQWPYQSQDQYGKPQSGTSSVLQITKSGHKGHRCSLHLQNQDIHGYTKDQWPYSNQNQDAKPWSGTSRILHSSKSGPKGHGCSLHLCNQYREPKFGVRVFKRSLTISKSGSRCKTQVRNLQHPPKPKSRTLKTWMFFAPSKIKIESQNSEHGSTKDQWPYPNQDQYAKHQSGTFSIKKDVDVLCTFQIKMESQNSEHRCTKHQWPYPNQDQDAKP